MTDTLKFVQAQKFALAGSGVTSTATSVTLKSFKHIDGTNIAQTDFGTKGWGTLAPGVSGKEEIISFTGVTQNADGTATLTTVTRGLKPYADYTADNDLRNAHAGGTVFVISNNPQLYDSMSGKANDETVTGKWTFPAGGNANAPVSSTSYSAPTDDLEYAAKKYVDNVAVAGAPDGAATVKGIYELASIAEAASGAAAGSGDTTAALAITTALTSNTSSAAQLIPVTDADGDIPVEFMELDAIWAFSGANTHAGTETFNDTLHITDPTDWQMNSIAFAHTMTLINEACAAFAATDITGAELETLSDGSDASAKHIHNNKLNASNTDVSLTDGNETTLYTYTLPANTLSTDKGIRVRVPMSVFEVASGATQTFNFKYGSTTVASVVLTGNPALSDGAGHIIAELFSAGTTSSQFGFLTVSTAVKTGGGTAAAFCGSDDGTATEDSTGALALTITATRSANNNSNDLTAIGGYTERI